MNDRLITIKVMNRSGHTEQKVGFEDATRIVREEMARGKWLRCVDENGNRYIESRIDIAEEYMAAMKDRLPDFGSVMLIAAVAGGSPDGMIEINGKFYPAGDVSIKVAGREVRISDLDQIGGKTAPGAGGCSPADKKPELQIPVLTRIITDEDNDNIISVFRNEDGDLVVELNNAFGLDEAKEALGALAVTLTCRLGQIIDGIALEDIVDEDEDEDEE